MRDLALDHLDPFTEAPEPCFFLGGSSQNERTSTATRMALFQDSKQPKRLCGPKKALERRPKPSRGCTQQRKYKMHLDYQPWKMKASFVPGKKGHVART